MTLPQPRPPHSSLHHIKPQLSPPRQLTPSSSFSSSPSSTCSLRSSSETYVNDIGSPCVADPNWPSRISRKDIRRVYDSTDDEGEVLQPDLRKHVLEILDTVDVGVYEDWALQADDALSIEELQHTADEISRDIDAVKPTKRRPRSRNDGDSFAHIPVMDMLESDDEDEKLGAWSLHRDTRHRRIETLPDDDLEDLMIADDVQLSENEKRERKRGHRRIETLDDSFDTGDGMRDVPIGAPPPKPPPRGKGGHRRIETLDDSFDIAKVPNGAPPLPRGKRGHRRIETLDDSSDTENIPNGVPPLPHGKRGHRRIETLDDAFDISEVVSDLSTSTPPLPPGKRGHRRIETLSDGTSTPVLKGHTRIETLEDVDLCEPPALKRIETLPDEPLDTPVLNGVQRMGFDDVMSIPLPPPLPSPVGTDDTPRGTMSSDVEPVDGGGIARIDSLSEDHTIEIPLDRRREESADNGKSACSKLSSLSQRATTVTRSLADVQMITASHAAAAEATLPPVGDSSKAEMYRLRITLDHLARLILERATQLSDMIEAHK